MPQRWGLCEAAEALGLEGTFFLDGLEGHPWSGLRVWGVVPGNLAGVGEGLCQAWRACGDPCVRNLRILDRVRV